MRHSRIHTWKLGSGGSFVTKKVEVTHPVRENNLLMLYRIGSRARTGSENILSPLIRFSLSTWKERRNRWGVAALTAIWSPLANPPST
jgi:hypothetical protein